MTDHRIEAAVERIDVSACKYRPMPRKPTAPMPGTPQRLSWWRYRGGRRGLGYTYADTATARLIADMLGPRVQGRHAMDGPASWEAMVHAIRNLGRPGIASMAISRSTSRCGISRRAC